MAAARAAWPKAAADMWLGRWPNAAANMGLGRWARPKPAADSWLGRWASPRPDDGRHVSVGRVSGASRSLRAHITAMVQARRALDASRHAPSSSESTTELVTLHRSGDTLEQWRTSCSEVANTLVVSVHWCMNTFLVLARNDLETELFKDDLL